MIIKEVSQITGISVDNLRYYERIGLIPPVPRTESGIRDYDEMSLQWIDLAMKFKKAGVPLDSIIEYIRLAMEGEHTKIARREILTEVRDNILSKINEMQEFLQLIDYKINNYYSVCLPAEEKLVNEWNKSKNGKE
ncbi:MerR family transcriptional regulator [Sporomusa acidovorans]|uniref:HTH-type transcriptional regulator AdhR n=1 Tax=Sporomusa acidovorans (strain ATCC 49682 / DSM 3132 / Mol) TaxID=1123286 RepID=A0ABZ3J2N1_SPOA4|nr:MerR family transcriptional regulator [Sporomusa acidovorans]OZC24159.1 HTH-type transcriptional regulator AdhR [Sporomusa acidovorans DSM 3132]SDF37591.1 DNA-binding transcriptional regulator, MerR family [Sporomusa acidovorans]